MADLSVSEHTKLSGLPSGWADAQQAQVVWLWDTGPEKPLPPARPKPPAGKEGDPEYDLGMLEFRGGLADYDKGLVAYKAAQTEYLAWQKDCGGPIERRFWSCDAADALARDDKAVTDGRQNERRYYVSARTRGHERLKNGGLPKDMKPGHGQDANLRREAEQNADLAAAMARDPVFGQQELRP